MILLWWKNKKFRAAVGCDSIETRYIHLSFSLWYLYQQTIYHKSRDCLVLNNMFCIWFLIYVNVHTFLIFFQKKTVMATTFLEKHLKYWVLLNSLFYFFKYVTILYKTYLYVYKQTRQHYEIETVPVAIYYSKYKWLGLRDRKLPC